MRQVQAILETESGSPYLRLLKLQELYQEDGKEDHAELVFYLSSMCRARDAKMSDKAPTTNIYGGNFANFNVGHQVGAINASIQVLNQRGPQAEGLAVSLDAIKNAVLEAQDANETQKKRLLDSLSLISTEAQKPEHERQHGVLEPVLDNLPKVLSSIQSLSTLWQTYGGPITSFFGSLFN